MKLSFLLENYREYNPYIKRLVVNVNDLVFTQVDICSFTDYVYCPKCHQWKELERG